MKKVIIAIICVIVAVAIGLVVLMGIGLGGGLKGLGIDMGAFADLVNRQTFTASQFEDISVAYKSDSVTLVPHSGDEIVLEEYMSSNDPAQYARVDTSGSSLRIQQGDRTTIVIFGINYSYIKLYIPEDWMGALDVSSKSGSVKCEDSLRVSSLSVESKSGSIRLYEVDAEGNVQLNAVSGSIHAERITCGGTATFSSASGSIKPGDVTARDITAEGTSGSVKFGLARADIITASCSSGSINFEQIEGVFDIDAKSGSIHVDSGGGHGTLDNTSGSIKITLDKLTGSLTANNTSGSIKLHLPMETGIDFSAQSRSGGIHTPFDDSLNYNKSGNQASGTWGTAPLHKVACQTASGGIRLEWN